MDKAEHAAKLRRAIDLSDFSREDIAVAMSRNYRTVSNWVSATRPTMPSEKERAELRRLLGPYDEAGDDVIAAINRSPLHEWRRDEVRGAYRRHLHEQQREEGA